MKNRSWAIDDYRATAFVQKQQTRQRKVKGKKVPF